MSWRRNTRKLDLKHAAQAIVKWTPKDRPLQFSEAFNPFNVPTQGVVVPQSELDEDATMPFFSEAYLYNLLGKEDARTLLHLMNKLLTAAGSVEEV